MIKNKTYSKKSYDEYLKYERIKFKAEAISKISFSSVLDVGCANGIGLHLLRSMKIDAKFLGIDNDQEMIDQAKEVFSNDKNSKFELSTIEDLSGELKFDLILLWGLISFYPSYEDLILKIKSHLTKHGSISIWSGFCDSEYDVLVSYRKDSIDNFGLNMFSLPKLLRYFEENNFSVKLDNFRPSVPLKRDISNPLVSYTLRDGEDGYVIANGLNIVRDFYHILVTNK